MPEVQTRFGFRSLHLAYLLIALSLLVTSACSEGSGDDDGTEGPSERPPVIFIPGITGSELVGTTDGNILWPPEGPGADRTGNIIGVRQDFVRLSLIPLKDGVPAEEIYATDAIRADGATQIYGPLINFLKNAGKYHEYDVGGNPARRTFEGCDMRQKASNPSFFVFAYDWRLPIEDNSELLANYVSCISRLYSGRMKDFKVNIVTHSMGGLVARRYIIDHPGRVDKLITIAAPFLGSPKPLFQMIYGKISIEWGDLPGEELFGTYGLLGSPLSEMLTYYSGLHQLMSTNSYFDLGGRPYSQITLTSLDNELGFQPFMGPGGVVDQLFPVESRNGKKAAQSNRDFHSYAKNGNNQDDWSRDSTGVKYYHLLGVQQANNTPLTLKDRTLLTGPTRPIVTKAVEAALDATAGRLLSAYASATISQTLVRDYNFSNYGPGDGTVPLLSGIRIGAGQNLNAPNAKLFIYSGLSAAQIGITPSPKISLYGVSDETHKPLDHAGIVTNTDVQAKVLELLQENDEQPIVAATATRTPTVSAATATRLPVTAVVPTTIATATRTPTRTPTIAPASPTAVAFKYVLKEVRVNPAKAPLESMSPDPRENGTITQITIGKNALSIHNRRVYDGVLAWDITFNFSIGDAPGELRVNEPAAFTLKGQWTGAFNCGKPGITCYGPIAEYGFSFGERGETRGIGLYPNDPKLPNSTSITVHYVLSPLLSTPTITLRTSGTCTACVIEWVYERANLN